MLVPQVQAAWHSPGLLLTQASATLGWGKGREGRHSVAKVTQDRREEGSSHIRETQLWLRYSVFIPSAPTGF